MTYDSLIDAATKQELEQEFIVDMILQNDAVSALIDLFDSIK